MNKFDFMARALELAAKGQGQVSPNPLVGSVVVKGEKIIGEGWHKKAGGPHAEIHALNSATRKNKGAAKGAELFVTLEPCCHFGKTPPCCDAIIKSGVKKVVVAMKDPNPLVNGKGILKMRRAGIKVEVGLLQDEAARMNEIFIKYIMAGTPFVIGKIASSLDGKIATGSGDSKWITNEKSRGFVHELRYSMDAILVGKNTVVKDDPELTARKNGKVIKSPYRIILGGKMDIPLNRKVFKMRDGKTILVIAKGALKGIGPNKKKKLEARGVKFIEVASKKAAGRAGRIDLKKLLKKLGQMGITSLMVEGGAETHTSFMMEGLIDKMYHFVAPLMIGENGISYFGDLGVEKVKNAFSLKNVEVRKFGDDVLFIGYPSKK